MSQPMQPRPEEILGQMATGYMAASCISVVARLGIADLLAAGPKDVSELAKQSGVLEDRLYRVMRALASAGVFTETSSRVFANTAASEALRTDAPVSFRNMAIWLADSFHFDFYRDMLPMVKANTTGIEHVFHTKAFDYIFSVPEIADRFNNAMTGFSAQVIPAVLEAYDFGGIGTLADIAGGHGMVLSEILKKNPQMKGILFDLPHVCEGARARFETLGIANRVEIQSGDFFKSVPAADGYVMKHIIHDWEDEEAITILKNCASHLKKGGKIVLIESVIAPGNDPNLGKWIDIEMFMAPGGRERTEVEYRDLLAKAGMKLTRVVPTQAPLWVVESEKI